MERPPIRGHGFFISPNGAVATAAHVLFPPEATLNGASTFIVNFYGCDPKQMTWDRLLRTIRSSDLREHAFTRFPEVSWITSDGATRRSPVRIQNSKSEPRLDWVIVNTGVDTPDGFVQLSGFCDRISNSTLQSSTTGLLALADYCLDGTIDVFPLSLVSDIRSKVSTRTYQFHPGVSGAPMFALTQERGIVSLFAVGIITNTEPANATTAYAVTIYDALANRDTRFEVLRHLNCKSRLIDWDSDSFPYKNSLLSAVGLCEAESPDDRTIAILADKLDQHVLWRGSAGYLRNKLKLAVVIRELGANKVSQVTRIAARFSADINTVHFGDTSSYLTVSDRRAEPIWVNASQQERGHIAKCITGICGPTWIDEHLLIAEDAAIAPSVKLKLASAAIRESDLKGISSDQAEVLSVYLAYAGQLVEASALDPKIRQALDEGFPEIRNVTLDEANVIKK